MLAEKLQHLIVKLSQKMMGANVLGKCKKSKMRGEREVVVVENDYQRTELPAKADGQWILFRSIYSFQSTRRFSVSKQRKSAGA